MKSLVLLARSYILKRCFPYLKDQVASLYEWKMHTQNLGTQAMLSVIYNRKKHLYWPSPMPGWCCGKHFSQVLFLFTQKKFSLWKARWVAVIIYLVKSCYSVKKEFREQQSCSTSL